MHLCDIRIFRDEKDHTYSEYRPVVLQGNTFYLSKELGQISHISLKIQNSRALGILLTQSNTFFIYNTGKYVMLWFPKSEKCFSTLVHLELGHHRGMQQCLDDNQRAIFFGDTNALAIRLLTGNGGYKKRYFSLDRTYEHPFATRTLERKMDFKTLSMILGHASVAFTIDTYAHVQDELKRKAMDLMDDLYAAE